MKNKKPPQPTIISRKTARSLAYLEHRGLANFDKSNLMVFTVIGPRNHRQARLEMHASYPHKLAV